MQQNPYTAKPEFTPPLRAPIGVKAPRQGKWLDTPDDVFAYLEQREAEYTLEKDSWWRSMSATFALLKHACIMMERTQARLVAFEDSSATDPLTGLLSRKGFVTAFSRELDRTRREKSTGGLLVMVDLDNHAAIEKRYGIDAGNAALQLMADTLKANIRGMDAAARLINDEFVILFADTNRKAALERAQKLAWTLNRLTLRLSDDCMLPVHASLGLKEYRSGDQADDILKAVGFALPAHNVNGTEG